MSYLHLPRLVFTGDFKSDVSTVNNDTTHYNNATFDSSFQQPASSTSPNGWWNPEGGASFDFQNCNVEQITLPDGAAQADDIISGCTISCADDRASGKMVDLDPQQQSVSQLWAVTLKVSTVEGELLFQGDIEPVGFRDLQFRQTDIDSKGRPRNGQALGGTWTSVLTNIEWGEKASSSDFLEKLRAVTQGDKLSLNLNAFGYYYAHTDGRFSLGRIVGAIGPWFEGEPELFAPARRLFGILPINRPRNPIYFAFSNFLFESEQKRLTIDFGGSFPVADPAGTINNPVIPDADTIINNPQKYVVGVSNNSIDFAPDQSPQIFGKDDFTTVGELNFKTVKDWLNKTGGIVVFDDLPDDVNGKLGNQQLVLLTPSANNPEQYVVIARESIDGYVIRADNCVQRLDYNQTKEVYIYAYQWGKPLASQNITITLEPQTPVIPQGPNFPSSPISFQPGNGYPENGITFPFTVQTDADGRARLDITGNRINNPRMYLDGQLYFLDYQLENIPNDPASAFYEPDRISIHLRDYFEVLENPAWSDISEIMTQFGNLYPIMSKYIVDLSKPDQVKAKKDILIFAFTRDISDPIYMPVTRDLSDAKRQTILNWLKASVLRLENEEKAALSKKAVSLDEAVMNSSAEPGAGLTERQIKARIGMIIKGGGDFAAEETTESLEDN